MTLETPILMLVTDPSIPDLLDRLESAIAGGVRLIQYRDKSATTEQRIRWVGEFRRRCSNALVLMNDDLQAVIGSEADGLHMSAGYQCDPEAAHRECSGRLLGRSIHGHGEALIERNAWSPDYLVFGTVYSSRSHPGGPASGLATLKAVTDGVRSNAKGLPVIAIGGIDETNAADCIRAGASGVAVVRSILMASDPATAAASILKAMREA
jgi:thiamine-phosphate diphosphorylase